MNAPSPESTDTLAGSDPLATERSIAETISACACEATDQVEFLKLVATEVAVAFQVGIVAVELGNGTAPMMLVSDDQLGIRTDRASIREILSNAAMAPVACEIPLTHATEPGAPTTRGLSVRIRESAERIAFLLIYSVEDRPSTIKQVRDLKQLSCYAHAIGKSISQLRGSCKTDSQLLADNDEVQHSRLTSALRHRQSLQLFHQDLDLDKTAYRIANETRRLLRCDRVSVLLPRANRYRVRAISGVSVIDPRSNSVRCAEALIDSASVMARPMMFPSDEPLPPQILSELDAYLDQTGVTAAMMLPLHRQPIVTEPDQVVSETINPFESTGEIVAVLMLEYFSGEPPQSISPAMSLVSSEALLALQNSLEHRKVFGLRLWKFVGSIVQKIRRPLFAFSVLTVIALLIASAYLPVDHYVIATGTAQPTEQRQVFASVDGIVDQIFVTDGQQINQGDPILELENAELETRAESITGEILTAAQRLSSIQAIRLSAESDPNQSGRLVMEERQLQSQLNNLRAQQTLIEKQRDELLVCSPIDGTVVAWQLDRRLSDRPVAKGNLLVSVVDQAGPWQLRLTVPDRNAGPVLEAFRESQSLPVRFAVATVPDASYAATLTSLSTATRMDESGQHVMDLFASVTEADADQIAADSLAQFSRQDVRLGADVTAKIGCGKRTILRSWFGDVFDFVDRNVVFYFR